MKNHKRALSITVAVIMLIALLPISAIAKSIPVREVYSGYCGAQGSNVSWSLDTETGILSITGTGEMKDYAYSTTYSYSRSDTPWKNYCSFINSVSISNGVTNIGGGAFYDCGVLTSVSIPESVTVIGVAAFVKCSSLVSITIPESVNDIEVYAFACCSSLVSITLPEALTSISNRAFWACNSLVSVILSDGLTSIGDFAFCSCVSLVSITFPYGLINIGDYAFSDCSSLVSIYIPNSVVSIGEGAFCNCLSLMEIAVDQNNPQYCSIDGVLFDKPCTTLMCFPCTKSGDYLIPDGVTIIAGYAFCYCNGLTSVTMPDSVTEILCCAFMLCDSLNTVTIGHGITRICAEAFVECYLLSSVIFLGAPPAILEYNAFDLCLGVRLYYTPEYASEWAPNGEQLFNYYMIEMIEYPEPTILFGDINMDGQLSFLDISVLNLIVIGMQECPEELFDYADYNQDGRISFSDISELYCFLIFN